MYSIITESCQRLEFTEVLWLNRCSEENDGGRVAIAKTNTISL